uniref:Uncharacterized protein n=1 Tax=Knipowitschia caucasica TaxID=637954 RepID=A0AAV2J2T3_KNICA
MLSVFVKSHVGAVCLLEEHKAEEKNIKKKVVGRRRGRGRRSTRSRKLISYRFDDFDDAINEAIQENRELSGRASRALSPVCGESLELSGMVNRSECPRPLGCSGRVRKSVRKRRRLNDLESDSTAADSEEDEYMLSHSSEEEEEPAVWGLEDEVCSDSLSGDRAVRRQSRGKRTCVLDSPQHMGGSSGSDSGEDSSRRALSLRRGQQQQVNYCESSSSDCGAPSAVRSVKRRREHESSDYSEASPFSRDSEEECAEEDGKRRRPLARPRKRRRHRPRYNPLTDQDTSSEEAPVQGRRAGRTGRKHQGPKHKGPKHKGHKHHLQAKS